MQEWAYRSLFRGAKVSTWLDSTQIVRTVSVGFPLQKPPVTITLLLYWTEQWWTSPRSLSSGPYCHLPSLYTSTSFPDLKPPTITNALLLSTAVIVNLSLCSNSGQNSLHSLVPILLE